MDITSLLEALGYSRSQGNWVTPDDPDPRVSSLFREAQRANVLGAYVYRTRRDDQETPPQPAVYVAHAADEDEARQIQKQLFCLGNCPFVLIITPNTVRAYTCFRYDADNPESARINPQDADTLLGLTDDLEAFQAEEIDSGHIWERLAKYLSSDKRVDTRLLNNLRQLSVQIQKRFSLPPGVAHALIGKYIYFYYLRDRGILGLDWLQKHQIAAEEIFGRGANVVGFQTLADALQTEFNGVIFPLPEGDDGHWRTDGTIPFLARIFAGDEFQEANDAIILQLALDFQVYDFSFIPVELLSSIYEQFLKDEGSVNTVGVVYTPEPLADYVLAEMEAVHPLRWGHRVLDPCCGSGVFLVLAYRHLVELARRERGVLTADQLKQILEDSIFGVERDPEACQITAFSLILT
nr:N-6 DNA methylase [Armatimonadota bacterium]